jgi:hypothetical protein
MRAACGSALIAFGRRVRATRRQSQPRSQRSFRRVLTRAPRWRRSPLPNTRLQLRDVKCGRAALVRALYRSRSAASAANSRAGRGNTRAAPPTRSCVAPGRGSEPNGYRARERYPPATAAALTVFLPARPDERRAGGRLPALYDREARFRGPTRGA